MKPVAAVHAVQEHHEWYGDVGGDLLGYISAPAAVLAREQVLFVVEFEVE